MKLFLILIKFTVIEKIISQKYLKNYISKINHFQNMEYLYNKEKKLTIPTSNEKEVKLNENKIKKICLNCLKKLKNIS